MIRILLFSTFISFNAFAAGGGSSTGGDGGFGVECFYQNGDTIEMLESYEFEKLFGEKVYAPNRTLIGLLNQMESNSKQALGPNHRFNLVLKRAHQFLAHMTFADQVPSIPVSGLVVQIPKNCRIMQIAVHRMNSHNEPEVTVYEKGWFYMSELNRAMLLTHEALHSWFKKPEEKWALRRAVMYLAAQTDFRECNHDAFIELVEKTNPKPIFKSLNQCH